MPMNKLLKVIFVILLIVLVGEIAYLFTVSSRKPAEQAPTPTPTNQIVQARSQTNRISEDDETTVFYTNQSIEKGVLKKASLVNEYEGIITEVKTENVESPFPATSPYKPEFKIAIHSNPEDPNTYVGFFFDKTELNNLTIKQADEPEDKTTYQDLKIGQRVNIIETYDFTTKKTIAYEITILQ